MPLSETIGNSQIEIIEEDPDSVLRRSVVCRYFLKNNEFGCEKRWLTVSNREPYFRSILNTLSLISQMKMNALREADHFQGVSHY